VLVEGAGALYRIGVYLPDPDVDDSGVVDARDLRLVRMSKRFREDKPGYDPRFDLDGDGRVKKSDEAVVRAAFGESVSIP
jgi:hypothetical protein